MRREHSCPRLLLFILALRDADMSVRATPSRKTPSFYARGLKS